MPPNEESDENPLAPASNTRAWITGSIGTLSNIDPTGITGAIVQAWTEFDEHKQAKRVSEFFEALKLKLEAVEGLSRLNAQRISSMPDAAELMEQCVEASIKEVNDDKRRIYSDLYYSFLASPDATSPEERFDIVQQLEQLTENDLTLLRQIARRAGISGAELTNGRQPGGYGNADPVLRQRFSTMSQDEQFQYFYHEKMHSTHKLEARGLIVGTAPRNPASMVTESTISASERYRRNAWKVTVIGERFARMITGEASRS